MESEQSWSRGSRFVSVYSKVPLPIRRFVKNNLPSEIYDYVSWKVFSRPRAAKSWRYRNWARDSFSQQGEDLVLDRVIRSRVPGGIDEPGFFVDVGAYHPVLSSVTHLLHMRGWQGLAVDPSEDSKKLFLKHRPNDKFIQAVAGSDDGVTIPFYLASKKSSLAQTNTTKPPEKSGYREVIMPQISLDAELTRSRVNRVDVVNIDVEGAELEVLSGFTLQQWKPKIIVIEIHERNLQEVMESSVATLLFEEGYELVASCVISHFFVRV